MLNAQQAADAAKKLDLIDRLGEKVVRSRLDAAFEVGRLIERGHHKNKKVFRLRIGANFLANFKAGQARHHHIE